MALYDWNMANWSTKFISESENRLFISGAVELEVPGMFEKGS